MQQNFSVVYSCCNKHAKKFCASSEAAFLNHVKQLFSKRDDGLEIKIKNAQGKGAKHDRDTR